MVLIGVAPAYAAPKAEQDSQAVAIGTGGAVASMDRYASQAGIDVLKRGGNAIDAAVATGSAMGVSVPFVAGPG
ncbi:MAG: gamma-glutamyltransferase, partial [Solirubrobacterales bacterium]|nr:gamma-glutamyltransferase [Solirubrobacterales bacterium]